MDRLEELRKYVSPEKRGIEIAPFHSPIVPKRSGYNVITMDVFDASRLREIAMSEKSIDPNLIDLIEDVDIVANAIDIGEIMSTNGQAGTFDYIVSSHNFEHLPDPIRFLQGCATALKPGGYLTMAIPDGRACFDHFRYPTRLSEWLEAYFLKRRKPTAAQIFDNQTLRANYLRRSDNTLQPGCSLDLDDPQYFFPAESLDSEYSHYRQRIDSPSDEYIDCHCSIVFGESLELMLRDLIRLGLIELDIVDISTTNFHEFYIHLIRDHHIQQALEDFYLHRKQLLEQINMALGRSGFGFTRGLLRQEVTTELIGLLTEVVNEHLAAQTGAGADVVLLGPPTPRMPAGSKLVKRPAIKRISAVFRRIPRRLHRRFNKLFMKNMVYRKR